MNTRILLCFAATTLVFATDPDFSGKWRLNESLSSRGRLAEPAVALLTVEHQGNQVRCAAAEKRLSWSFTTDRKESRYRLGETSRSTVVKWEGDALLVNTIVNGRGPSYTVMDRWRLSRDGRTLKIERAIESVTGESEGTLVYDRLN